MRSLFALPLAIPAAMLAFACSRDATATAPDDSARVDMERLSVPLPAPNGFTSQPLSRGSFSDKIDASFRIKEHGATKVVHVEDPSEMVMARITIVPGGALPWHTHPGPAMVTVAAGQLTVVDSHECAVRRYSAGASFMDTGQGHVHTAFNAGDVDMVLYVTYLDVPAGQSPLVPTQGPSC